MYSRSLLILVAVCGLVFHSGSGLSARQNDSQTSEAGNSIAPQDEPAVSGAPQLMVIPVRNVDAAEVVSVVQETFGNRNQLDLSLTADSRSNSIIIAGNNQALIDQVQNLVNSLDVVPPVSGELSDQQLRVYSVSPASVDEVANILQVMFADQPMKLQTEVSRNQIVLMASPELHERVAEALAQLGVQPEGSAAPAESVYLAITLVVEASQVPEESQNALREPSGEIAALLNGARERGLVPLENPMVATHSVSNVRCSVAGDASDASEFSIESQRPAAGYHVRSMGSLIQKANGQFLVNCETQIDSFGTSSMVASNIAARLDHPVLLSFASIGDIDSALIIRVTTEQADPDAAAHHASEFPASR